MNPDLVYVCRNGENEELRYSLRSVARNLPHGRVWIFGGWPAWIEGVKTITTEQAGVRFANTTNAVRLACEHSAVSDPFVLMNDDFFVMQPLDSVPVLNRGPISKVISDYERRHMGGSAYAMGMRHTCDLLVSLGFENPVSYELHVPLLVHKAAMLEALSMGQGVKVLHKRSMYGNLARLSGATVPDVKVYRTGADVPQGPFASCQDNTLPTVLPVLRYLFPLPCAYERPEPAPRRVIRFAPCQTQAELKEFPMYKPRPAYSETRTRPGRAVHEHEA